MNEVFDIKRFGKLVQYEVVNYMPRFFKSLLIFASIIFATWMLSLTMDSDIWEESRAGHGQHHRDSFPLKLISGYRPCLV